MVFEEWTYHEWKWEGIFLRFLNLKSMQHKIELRLLLNASAFQIWLVLFDQIN